MIRFIDFARAVGRSLGLAHARLAAFAARVSERASVQAVSYSIH